MYYNINLPKCPSCGYYESFYLYKLDGQMVTDVTSSTSTFANKVTLKKDGTPSKVPRIIYRCPKCSGMFGGEQ